MRPLGVAPGVAVTVFDGRGVVAISDGGHDVFAGARYAAVMRAVDGIRGEDDLVAPAGGERAIADMIAAGVLVECDGALGAADGAWWRSAGLPPRRAAERLEAACVAVAVVGDVDARPVRSALREAGVAEAGDAPLRLVLTDDYLRDEVREHNERGLDDGRPWMLARTGAVEAWLGPVVAPDRGPCWECLAQRLRRNRPIGRYRHAAAAGSAPTPVPHGRRAIPSTDRAVAGMVATAVLRWTALDAASDLAERLVSIDTRTWYTTRHAIVRRPQCPACGVPDPPEVVKAPPLALAATGQAVDAAGELRTVAPEVTIERYEHHVSPITGAVDRLVRASGARPPLHAYLAGDPGPRRFGDDDGWMPGAWSPAGGKGTTDLQARVSALCEALERYSGVFGGEEPRRVASLDELAGAAVHPNAVMGFSDAQYAARDATNREAPSPRSRVPVPFDAAARVPWTPLWSLSAQRERWLPTAYCFYEAHVPGADAVLPDSNGNAAGNTVEEAILQGLLELIERDHVALWWYNRLQLPGLDLDAFGDPWLDAVRRSFAGEGREVWALDLTADLGVPAVAALASAPEREAGVALGFGAHLDPGRALRRAVSELVQLNAGVPSGGAGTGRPGATEEGPETYLRPAPDLPPRTPADASLAPSGDLRTDLGELLARVEAQGLEAMVLDQTRADIGLPVVKVVVPGLRHFWRRLAPGRLYDVPVTLGHLGAPRAEGDLNPAAPAV